MLADHVTFSMSIDGEFRNHLKCSRIIIKIVRMNTLNGLANAVIMCPYVCSDFMKLVQVCGFHSKLSEKKLRLC